MLPEGTAESYGQHTSVHEVRNCKEEEEKKTREKVFCADYVQHGKFMQ